MNRITDARLDELVQWHEAFPLNPNGADTLAALRELRTCRKLVREYLDAVDALNKYVSYEKRPWAHFVKDEELALANLRAFIAGEG